MQAETCQILSSAENPRWSPSVAINKTNKMKKMNKINEINEIIEINELT